MISGGENATHDHHRRPTTGKSVTYHRSDTGKSANNIHILNAITKKGRMEHIVLVDTDESYLDDVCSLLALEFGTLGIKTFKYEHVKFPFETRSKKVIIQADDIHLEMEVRVKFVKRMMK